MIRFCEEIEWIRKCRMRMMEVDRKREQNDGELFLIKCGRYELYNTRTGRYER